MTDPVVIRHLQIAADHAELAVRRLRSRHAHRDVLTHLEQISAVLRADAHQLQALADIPIVDGNGRPA